LISEQIQMVTEPSGPPAMRWPTANQPRSATAPFYSVGSGLGKRDGHADRP
jgi:hypothetical protein